ncbi:MAG: zinc-finger domain-containing protein [Anaplasma sp.]
MSDKTKNSRTVHCDGNDAEGLYSGHPRVYVKIVEGKNPVCPYCGRVLN